ncbi:TIGR01906 family membrane protein [Dehalogenimonas alkenigignens]|uniref:Integral membrane protein n=1 Tax=Dehalogenimonas alkenigignens TaxID=1217799 RepID=A0A0W0GGG2_9CHLR|nr:TIGR01906 family membrane protein [Dehalogenimonas alkenigignens]KTB47627.1 integral membrane protein [Dehalogenimonas alkenigignens]PVV82834.1 TIGR01906 family membrane protein [Dehalogenimonas alkenigignens]
MNKLGRLALRAAAWGLVPAVPLLITGAVIAFAVNFQPLYEYGFDRYDVGRTTGLSEAELSKAARGLIDYFNSGAEFIDLTVEKDGRPFALFNDREIVHLYDVKGLIRLDYWVLALSLAYAAAVSAIMVRRREPQRLAAPLFWGGMLALGIVISRAVIAIVDFDAFFVQFHMVSFVNDFWLLNPATDYLIMLFPGGFWRDAMVFVDVIILSLTAAVTVVAWRHVRVGSVRS